MHHPLHTPVGQANGNGNGNGAGFGTFLVVMLALGAGVGAGMYIQQKLREDEDEDEDDFEIEFDREPSPNITHASFLKRCRSLSKSKTLEDEVKSDLKEACKLVKEKDQSAESWVRYAAKATDDDRVLQLERDFYELDYVC